MPKVAQVWNNHIKSPGVITPEIEVDMQQYANTAALLADGATWLLADDHFADGGGSGALAQVVLDTGVAAPGYSKSMRYDFNHGTNGCTSPEVRRHIPFSARQQVWAEFLLKWSPNFTTHQAACFPNDHKLIFGETEDDLSFRWGFHVGMDGDVTTGVNHTIGWDFPLGSGFPSEGIRYSGILANDLWDGNWHTLRFYIRNSTTPSSADGTLKQWIDGTLYKNITGFNTYKVGGTVAEKINGFSFTHNKDDGPPSTLQQIWWQRVRIYNQDPGW